MAGKRVKIVMRSEFFGGCTVIKEGKRIASGVSYETAVQMAGDNGEIWHEFMDRSGYRGLIQRPPIWEDVIHYDEEDIEDALYQIEEWLKE